MNFKNEPRGLRNNNPGNINKGVGFVGEKKESTDSRFAQFDSVEHGIRAIGKLLDTYNRNGFDTIEEVINRYAPAADNNNTEAYINKVMTSVGKARDEKLTAEDRVKLVSAIVEHENGFNPFSDQFISRSLAIG